MVDNPPSTIPPNILDTSAQPDLIIIEEQCVTHRTHHPIQFPGEPSQCQDPKGEQGELPACACWEIWNFVVMLLI